MAQHSTGAASAATLARAFLATGGRIMLNAEGRLESQADLRRIFDPETDPETAREVWGMARAYAQAERRQRGRIAALVASNGTAHQNGWLVWEGR